MIRAISIFLAALFLLQPAIGARAAAAQSAEEEARKALVRQQVQAAGVDAQVEVQLLNKKEIQGQLIYVGAKDFMVLADNAKSTDVETIRFQDVKSFKAKGAERAPAPAPAPASHPPMRGSHFGKGPLLMLAIGIGVLVFGIVTYIHTK